MVLDLFSPATREWFAATFPAPTAAQEAAWPAIAAGEHTVLLAPTGSGKTLAAFMWAIDRLGDATEPHAADPDEVPAGAVGSPSVPRGTQVLYISPLRALAVDVDKNLRGPIRGIGLAAERLGVPYREPTVALRTGDTPSEERRRLARTPPDVLITTPESLYLILTSAARETLRSVRWVIIDEIHAMAGTKRGAHLAVSLERLEELTAVPPQRIGLSATQRPLEEIARFLGGHDGNDWRPVRLVDAGVRRDLDVEVVVPVEDMGSLGEILTEPVPGPAAAGPVRRSIWPAIHPVLLEMIESHTSTIVFVNSRRLAERLAARLNQLAEERDPEAGPVDLVRAHHGSLSRERRVEIEDRLKRGELRGLVATSSLELGIDMGAVDLVVQVQSPGAVARGLQRIGRAGHQVGAISTGRIVPTHRMDLLEAAVVTRAMGEGAIEATRFLRNPLDVLAQQIVAMCALEEWDRAVLAAVLRRAAPFQGLSEELLAAVLDMLAGRYPSEEFAELRPRIVWDRVQDRVRGRPGAQRLAVTNPGTIPDRGLYGVFLPDGSRVGELDEEMVYESRPGQNFMLGASTWRIEDITHDRVIVTPAPGEPGTMPFWHGDGPGRPIELGRAMGVFLREIGTDRDPESTLATTYGLDPLARRNLLQFLAEQRAATGVVPDDRTIVVERFLDDIGDRRVCVLSPFGARVHAPWALTVQNRLEQRYQTPVETLWSDDGIVVRLPDVAEDVTLEDLRPEVGELDEMISGRLATTALFAGRFRECAARALLLPRRRPDQRSPLWRQRQRAAELLHVAARHPGFPILLETTREVVTEVFDLPALRGLLADLESRRIRMVAVDTGRASPFAQSLLFGWLAVYMYEGDAPLAERRAMALTLDRDLLRALLGEEELRTLLDPQVAADLEMELQCLHPARQARTRDEVHDLVRTLGPLTPEAIEARCVTDLEVGRVIEDLLAERRVLQVKIAGRDLVAAAEDAARLRDALGIALPVGLPSVFTEAVDDPLGDLVQRYARTHLPFTPEELAAWLGVATLRVQPPLERLEAEGRLIRGGFRRDGRSDEFSDPEVLRRLRRGSLAALRREVAPVTQSTYARFIPQWQGCGAVARGVDAVADAVAVLQGAAIAASELDAAVMPLRVPGYRPADLDALCQSGEVVWVGAGSIGAVDGRIRLYFRDQINVLAPEMLVPAPHELDVDDPYQRALHDHLRTRGASFWPDLLTGVAAAGLPALDAPVLEALWDLVWAGVVTNDSLVALRARVRAQKPSSAAGAARRRARPGSLRAAGPPAAAGRWSLVSSLGSVSPAASDAGVARALQLLERYGVLTRESALAEGISGGFAGLYPVLRALEEAGRVRRGYFVEGLGAAQFALPGAVDRLRSLSETPRPSDGFDDPASEVLIMAAADPAQPYGAALAWPSTAGRPARAAGAVVVLASGCPLVWLERGGRSVLTFPEAHTDARWMPALAQAVTSGRLRSVEIARIDGESVGATPWVTRLEEHGFVRGYRGMRVRSSGAARSAVAASGQRGHARG